MKPRVSRGLKEAWVVVLPIWSTGSLREQQTTCGRPGVSQGKDVVLYNLQRMEAQLEAQLDDLKKKINSLLGGEASGSGGVIVHGPQPRPGFQMNVGP